MKTRHAISLGCALVVLASVHAQGPASCGFHLDVRANGTGTHSAVADIFPGGPGTAVGMPTGFPGSPYTAYAAAGSTIVLTMSGNPLAFGPGPLGPGSCATLLYNIGSPQVPMALGPPFIPTCSGAPHIIGILPGAFALSTIIDTCGFLAPPPAFGLMDTPFNPTPGRITFTAGIPPFAPSPINFQVAFGVPGGLIAVTNAVSVVLGPNPFEVPVPAPVACGAGPALDDGQSLGIPTPPGFAFYGVGVPMLDMDTNGFVDFLPGAGTGGGCDITGAVGDLCAAAGTNRPRVDVNHADYDFGVVPAGPYVPAMTMEMRPPGPTWQDALILRWKNAPAFGVGAGVPGLSTACLSIELQGGACGCSPPNRIVVTREWISNWLTVSDQCGIGPGLAAHGFGGPPPAVAPSTCPIAVGIPFMGTFAPPFGFPYAGGPAGVIHMDPLSPFLASNAVGNSAILFTPAGPGYTLTVH